MRSARGVEQQNLSPFVKKVINEGKPFTDSQFPANINSLLDTANANGGLDKRSVEWYKKIEWRRAPEIYLGGCSVFKRGVEPTDIKQGKLADCYLLSVLSALAEIPGRVESLFNTTKVNQAGIYSINLFINGKRTEVIVDDLIPCDPVS